MLKTLFNKKRIILVLSILFIFFIPLFVAKSFFYFSSPKKIEKLKPSDAVIVFGTLVRDKKISPLMRQRLEAARLIYMKKKAAKIVVSNTESASEVMKAYLISRGIPAEKIELDIGAERTVDSCIRERNEYGTRRQLIYVSQSYHLPRIIFQCWRKDLKGRGFAAEVFVLPPSNLSFFEVVSIRMGRQLREAGLMWFALFRN